MRTEDERKKTSEKTREFNEIKKSKRCSSSGSSSIDTNGLGEGTDRWILTRTRDGKIRAKKAEVALTIATAEMVN